MWIHVWYGSIVLLVLTPIATTENTVEVQPTDYSDISTPSPVIVSTPAWLDDRSGENERIFCSDSSATDANRCERSERTKPDGFFVDNDHVTESSSHSVPQTESSISAMEVQTNGVTEQPIVSDGAASETDSSYDATTFSSMGQINYTELSQTKNMASDRYTNPMPDELLDVKQPTSPMSIDEEASNNTRNQSISMLSLDNAHIKMELPVKNTTENADTQATITEHTIEVFHVEQLFGKDNQVDSPTSDENDVHVGTEHSYDRIREDPLNSVQLTEVNAAREACYQRPVIQPCSEDVFTVNSTTTTWYYDPVEMACHLTSDCIINANAFPSEEACRSTCVPLSGIRRCLAPPKAGYFQCSQQNPAVVVAPILMVFFDKTTGKCRWFTYYGCGGTANRFRSIAECETTCSDLTASKIFLAASDLCQTAPTIELQQGWPSRVSNHLESDGAVTTAARGLFEEISLTQATIIERGCENVGQAESRWYLDVASGVCKEFAYSHCGGSANNFLARTDCEQFCAAKKEIPADICRQPPDEGQCSANQTMWYFDPSLPDMSSENGQGSCRTFTYTGCAGNSNRFNNRATCESVCGSFREIIQSTEAHDRDAKPVPDSKTSNNRSGISNGALSLKTDTRVKDPSSRLIDPLSIDLEPCRRPPQTGRCRPLNCTISQVERGQCVHFTFQRWFFNAHTSNCEPFNYTGCGGSENTFDDAESCHLACKARIVRPDRDQRCDSLPHQTKCYTLSLSGTPGAEQKDNVIAFHFSIASATCKAFQLDTSRPGCSMKPYFSNGQECIRACVKSTPTERHLQNRCFARKTHLSWNCSTGQEKTYRWSYLSELNQCVRFSQCDSPTSDSVQPGNNFATRAICETTCMATSFEEVCQLPNDPGPCRANQARYYYDTKTAQCHLFLYGGCLGNANRFVTRRECLAACSEFSTHVILQPNMTRSYSEMETNQTVELTETEPQSVSVDVFDRMWRITQHHTDHFPWDLCLEGHSYGTCPVTNIQHGNTAAGYPHTQLTRYFYDRRLGKCQPFTYTGCGARGNHFDTIDTCKIVCEDRLRNPKGARCAVTVELKRCPGSGVTGWAFNHSIGDCQHVELCPTPDTAVKFQATVERLRLRRTNQWHGVWQAKNAILPTGVYATRSACQYHCLPKPPRGTDAQNVCHMNPIVTVPVGCNAMVTRWYFDPREATCRSYITCPQYGNNFPSEKVCQDICVPTHPSQVCRQPLDLGGCSQFITRWYYDVRTRICRPFFYGGCFGNSNRFLTKAECDSMCAAQDVCRQPIQKMSTDPTYPKRYYFNQSSQRCEPFHFTGLLAHGNNFLTMAACNATCLFVPDIDAIAMPQSNDRSAQTVMNSGGNEVKPVSIGNAHQLGQVNSSQYPVVGPNTLANETNFQSPCLTPLSSAGASELEKQTICDPEDIIRELGYRFRAIENNDGANRGQIEGICELTLVPICLSEPKMVFGGIMDSRMRTIGRVFQTQAECEKTCLNNRRIRRSVLDDDNVTDSIEETQLEAMVQSVLEKSGYESDESSDKEMRNGCPPEQVSAEQVDRFQHDFQAFTRWPCKFDTEHSRTMIPLIESLTGQDVILPCWILSVKAPRVRWIRLKDNKAYAVAPIRMPALNHIWMAPLHLTRVHPLRHNGAWTCEATDSDEERVVEQLIQVHVIPRTFDKPHGHPQVEPITERVVHVPEGGTLLLACSFMKPGQKTGYFYEERIKWTRPYSQHTNTSTIILPKRREVQFLYIHPVHAKQHAGPWSCRNNRGDQLNYFVEVGTAPEFDPQTSSPQSWSVSKHRRLQHLHCPHLVNWGNPRGRLTWLRCDRRTNICRPVPITNIETENQLIVYPQPDDVYLCRVQNMWGRTQKQFTFHSYRYHG